MINEPWTEAELEQFDPAIRHEADLGVAQFEAFLALMAEPQSTQVDSEGRTA